MRNKHSLHLLMVALVAAITLLQGCAAGLVSDGGNRQPTRQQDRSLDQVAKDGDISSQITSRLRRDRRFNGVNASTFHGVVTLHGRVTSRALIEQAINTAKSISGVKRVISRLDY